MPSQIPVPLSPSLSALPTASLRSSLLPIATLSETFTNWASTYRSRTTATFRPRTVEEVRRVVELARREGRECRAAGSGHSPSDLVCTEGFVVNVDRLGELLEVDPTTSQIHVQGGIKLSALHRALTPHSLALSSLGSISEQTLAGALSTATHGSGITFGNLSTTVTFLDLVLPLPGIPVVRVSEESDPELFKSALCGLGAVGVVVGVGVQCEKVFKLEEECWTIGLAEFVERWEEIAGSAEHVRCWWFPQVGEVKVSRMNRTTMDLTPPPPVVKTWVTEHLIAKHFHALVLALTRYFPNLLPYHAHLMWALVHRPAPIEWSKIFRPVFPTSSPAIIEGERTKLGAAMEDAMGEKSSTPLPMLTKPTYRVDISNNIFNYDCGFPQYTYEGAIPFSRTGECLLALEAWHTKELNDPKGLRSHFPIEIRFTEKDDIWLSPTYGMRGTYIGAIQYRPFNLPVPYKALFSAFESHLLEHGGRPHWAKSHNVSRTQLQALYPRFGDFLEVRKRVDPQGVLLNAYTRRHLLGEVGEEVDMRRFKAAKR